MDDDAAELSRLFALARKSGKAFSMGRPILDDVAKVVQALQWIIILAVPRLFGGLTRTPPREHLLAGNRISLRKPTRLTLVGG